MNKEQVRKKALHHRSLLSSYEVVSNSEKICEKLKTFCKEVNGIYLPYGNEVDVTSITDALKQATFAIPKTNKDHTMCFYQYDSNTQLERSPLGIWEPETGRKINSLDVIIIPIVAFDELGNRLGHGAGYYDRYLADFMGLRIGVAHECQKMEDVYPEEHDIPLDIIITEKQIYTFKNHE